MSSDEVTKLTPDSFRERSCSLTVSRKEGKLARSCERQGSPSENQTRVAEC